VKILEKALPIVAATAAVGAAAATAVVAAAFALFAFLRDSLGPAGAAAVVAAVAAAIVAAVAVVIVVRTELRERDQPPEPTLMERAGDLVREHPVMAAGGALAAGLMALKNPSLAAALIGAFIAPKAASPRRDDPRRRRR
jgi:hypothetical protein